MLQWIEMDKLTRKLKEPYDFYLEWKKCKDYLEKNCDVKEQLWSFDRS